MPGWWHLSGANVCAHVGTSEASVETARDKLRELFDYQGRGYTSVEAMLAAERPDWVDVASSNACHYRHARDRNDRRRPCPLRETARPRSLPD